MSEHYQLSRLILKGYKSIADCDIEFKKINVLIGANGAGKSNLLKFFKLLPKTLDDSQWEHAVAIAGGPDALLHFGRKKTEYFSADLRFGKSSYKFIAQSIDNSRILTLNREGQRADWGSEPVLFGAQTNDTLSNPIVWDYVIPIVQRWRLYHFHDTGSDARVKQLHGVNDIEYLREDARNLAAFLYRLKKHHSENYSQIVRTVQLVAPFFGDFHLQPDVDNAQIIQLQWTENGQDTPFYASALSDGTLRFICLATLFLQPQEFIPSTILIDEPELGLHPYAVCILGALIRSASAQSQVIISTQSVELINEFEADDLIVVDKQKGASTFKRLDTAELTAWLNDYTLGELWKKNVLGGRPGR
jgi:predicted ATPase